MTKLTISARNILLWLLLCLGVLLILHLFGQYLWHIQGLIHPSIYVDRFNMNEEISLPTWFASFLLLFVSVLMGAAGSAKTQGRSAARYWKVLAVIFLFLSIDEGSSFHEVLSDPMRALLNIQSGWLYYAWVVPGAALAIAAIIYFFRFWRNLPASVRSLVGLASFLYLSGALGVELLGTYYASAIGGYDFNYFLSVALEESLEKLGLIILIYALIRYLAQFKAVWSVTFRR